MKEAFRLLGFAAIVLAASAILYGGYKMTVMNYFAYNPFTGLALLLAGLAGLVLLYQAFRRLSRMAVLLLPMAFALLEGCSYAKSNQQVVVSSDCGVTWERIGAGEAVPRPGVNPCYMKVVIPNFPMQGESRFITNLKDKVRTVTHIDYDYTIVDPLAFIKQAKFLGKANADADDEDAVGTDFEGAENMVIDKRIKDVAKGLFVEQDIVELDQSELEDKLLTESNTILKPLGIQLNFITLTFDLDEQTRQAIDIATAMKIYRSRNLEDIGREVMKERAGATKIVVENKAGQAQKSE
jgi:hypothetical protein